MAKKREKNIGIFAKSYTYHQHCKVTEVCTLNGGNIACRTNYVAPFSPPASMSIQKVKIPEGCNGVYTPCKVPQSYSKRAGEVSKAAPICKRNKLNQRRSGKPFGDECSVKRSDALNNGEKASGHKILMVKIKGSAHIGEVCSGVNKSEHFNHMLCQNNLITPHKRDIFYCFRLRPVLHYCPCNCRNGSVSWHG